MTKAHKSKKQGFTLIELLIVIAIIGLLATLAIVSLSTAQQKARDSRRIADIKQIQNAVELYFSQASTSTSVYPNTSTAATCPTCCNTWAKFTSLIGPYITNVPVDPANSDTKYYSYATNNAGTEYYLGAELEATNNALSGDDDINYSNALSGWSSILSITSLPSTGSGYDCGVAGPDTNLHYCVSE